MAGLRRGAALFDYFDVEKTQKHEKPTPDVDVRGDHSSCALTVGSSRSGSAAREAARDGKENGEELHALAAVRNQANTLRPPDVSGPTLPASGSNTGTRFVEIVDDRLRIHLTTVSAAIALFAGSLLVFGIYELGRVRGVRYGLAQGYENGRAATPSEATDEISFVQRQAPATDLVRGLLKAGTPAQPSVAGRTNDSGPTAGSAGRPAPDGQVGWVSGRTYIVAQEFVRDADQAVVAAQAFLQSRGVATVAVRGDNGVVRLITAKGFDRQEPGQRRLSDEYIEKIRTAGAEYYRSGGGYKLEGYFATLKGDSW